MNNSRHTFAVAMLVLGTVFTTSPLVAHQAAKPATGHNQMMGNGGMGGDMMGMMNMMEQMNKMMGLCNKMMETAMKDTDSKPQMPMDGQTAPEKKN